jgi:hypothetical protein
MGPRALAAFLGVEQAMLASAAGIVVAAILFWVAGQFFGGRFSHFPYSGL